MTKAAALLAFFSQFGIPAYPSTSVPDDATYPRLTYDPSYSAWDGGEVSITVNLWYYTESEALPNAKAQEISDALGLSGKTIPCDGGMIWLKRGSPFAQPVQDTDNNVKRRYINISAEFITIN